MPGGLPSLSVCAKPEFMGLLDNYLPRTGEILAGRYRLEEEIGRGAFGVVFRAVHEALDSNVAVKVLRPRVVDEPHVRKRFEREIAVAKTLQHPNSVRILDVDATLKGLPFYVMEYVDGRTLREVISDEGPLPPDRVRHITEQVLKSLAEAHARGIVHRDLKPGNIMLYDLPGETDVVKVLDFGIAKALGTNESFETAIGTVLGTPYYMSPEQASGAVDLDARSDLYALGIIIADCVGFSPEYEADTAMEHLAAQLMPDPLPFPTSIGESALWPVIQKATEKVASRRYQNALEMREALLAARSAGAVPPPVATAPPSAASPQAAPVPDRESTVDERVSVSLLLPESRAKLYAIAGVVLGLVILGLVVVPAFTSPATEPALAETSGPQAASEAGSKAPETNLSAQLPVVEDAAATPEPELPPPIPTGPVIAIARLSVGAALPDRTTLTFEGHEGTEISAGGRTLGVLPFSADVPSLPAEFEFTASRRGRANRALGRLDANVVEVPDPAPRSSSRSGSSRSEPVEPAEVPTTTPFGTAPIHD